MSIEPANAACFRFDAKLRILDSERKGKDEAVRNRDGFFGAVSRRVFIGTAASAAGMYTLPLTFSNSLPQGSRAATRTKPDSKFNGVQIGVITYSFRDLEPGIEGVLKACVESGCSSIELMSSGIEEWCGAPNLPARVRGPAGGTASRGWQLPTLEQRSAQDKYNADLKAWRSAAPMNKFVELRKIFNDAGIKIHIVKWAPARWSDEDIDYAFKTAKALGANCITDELTLDAAKRLGPIAENHGMIVALHTHMQFATPGFEEDVLKPAFAVSRAVKLNFDVGHFAGSTGRHPNEIMDRYGDRIFSLHLKDKSGPKTTPPNQNQVWGQGETPLEDVLLKVRHEKLPYFCDIELEYSIAAWSTSAKEVRTCLKYARQILI